MVLPMTCHEEIIKGSSVPTLFEPVVTPDKIVPCAGCKKNNPHLHNGVHQVIADWDLENDEPIEIVEFHTLMKND